MPFQNYDKGLYRDLGFIRQEFQGAQFQGLVRQYIGQALDVVIGKIKRRLPKGTTGGLRNALRKQIISYPDGSIEGLVIIPDSEKASQYAYYAIYGRGPGKMPPWGVGSSLYKWVSKKVIADLYRKSGKTPRRTPSRDKAILSIAFLIARWIGKHGTFHDKEGKYPLPQSFELGWLESEGQVNQILDYGLAIAITGTGKKFI